METASATSSPETEEIGDDQLVARCLLYSQFFDGGRLAEAAIFKFEEKSPDSSHYVESLVWRKYAPAPGDVHNIGCAIAANQNAYRSDPPPGDEKRRYYVGFSDAPAADCRTDNERFRTEVVHHEEDGLKAHTDLRLYVKGATKILRAAARTEAGLMIARALSAANPHTCACDADDAHHPLIKFGPDCLDRAA